MNARWTFRLVCLFMLAVILYSSWRLHTDALTGFGLFFAAVGIYTFSISWRHGSI